MNDLLSSIGLGSGYSTIPDLSAAGYDNSNLLSNDSGANPAGAAATSPLTTSGNQSFLSGLLNFANAALPVAAGVNNLVNTNNGRNAANNTASATGAFALSPSNPLLWIVLGGIGLVVAFLLLRKD